MIRSSFCAGDRVPRTYTLPLKPSRICTLQPSQADDGSEVAGSTDSDKITAPCKEAAAGLHSNTDGTAMDIDEASADRGAVALEQRATRAAGAGGAEAAEGDKPKAEVDPTAKACAPPTAEP